MRSHYMGQAHEEGHIWAITSKAETTSRKPRQKMGRALSFGRANMLRKVHLYTIMKGSRRYFLFRGTPLDMSGPYC